VPRYRTAVGGRERCRVAADDPKRWRRYLAAIDAQLEKGETSGFEAMFRNGYGAPPQALDVRTNLNSKETVFICHFADGTPVFTGAEVVPEEALN
jgi:hypothetical protein